MASIKGAIDLTGKPGEVTKNKIRNDENFLRTRENNLEWKSVHTTVSLAKVLFWLKNAEYSLIPVDGF